MKGKPDVTVSVADSSASWIRWLFHHCPETLRPLHAIGTMSSSASSHRNEPPPPHGDEADSTRANQGGAIPSSDNQQTVISHRPPIATSSQSSSETNSRHQSTIVLGTRLGDIELTEHIGGGGMGQVFRGEDKRLGRAVAVKVLSRDQSSDQEAVRRFLNEAKSAARLNHQNIAQVYSAGESGEHPYIVFEYVQGVNLRTMVEEQGPLMLEEALSYTLQIADALAHAADRRIVHRDVKPSNVLIAPNGQAKLIDLGLARLSTPGASDGDLTASGVTLGTFDYISPEQARDPRNADSRSDIYSLGCTLFYMLAGRPPFPEGTVLQKLLQHQGDDPPDICQFRPDLPDEAGQVLGKMMAKDPRRRYPDSARLMESLLTLADLIGLRPTGPAQAIWLPPQESRISVLHRQTPWLAPTLTLACLILALHLLWTSKESTGEVWDFRKLGKQAASSQITEESESGDLLTPAPSQDTTLDEASGSVNQKSDGHGGPATDPLRRLLRASASSSRPPFQQSLLAKTHEPGHALPAPALAASFSPDTRRTGLSIPSLLGSLSGRLSAPAAPLARTKASPAPDATSTIPLVINPSPQGDHQYRSIRAALEANPEATLIELRYDGRGIEKPLTLAGRQLTIRAGSGRSPVLAFEPAGADPVLYPRDMIQVSDGKLLLQGIAIELAIPRDVPSESWSLVRLSAGGHIRFEACSLRVRNASDTLGSYHQDVAFFRASPQPSQAPPSSDGEPDIDLLASIACGEASLVRASESTSLQVRWQNGLLATTETAFWVGGSSREQKPGAKMDIEWHHVTAVMGDSLIHITLPPHRPHLAPFDFSKSSACVLSSRNQPLIQVNGVAEPGDLLNELRWPSAPPTIQDSLTPLSITDASGAAVQDDELTSWIEAAGLSKASRLVWQAPASDMPAQAPGTPVHSLGPDNFKLNLTESEIPDEAASSPGFLTDQPPGPPAIEPLATD